MGSVSTHGECVSYPGMQGQCLTARQALRQRVAIGLSVPTVKPSIQAATCP
jgi:hypothetical protein